MLALRLHDTSWDYLKLDCKYMRQTLGGNISHEHDIVALLFLSITRSSTSDPSTVSARRSLSVPLHLPELSAA